MPFALIHHGRYRGPGQQFVQQGHGEIGHANLFHLPRFQQSFHGPPGIVNAALQVNLLSVPAVVQRLGAIVVTALEKFAVRQVVGFKCHGPMNQVQVQILESQIAQRLGERSGGIVMQRRRQFAHHVQVGTVESWQVVVVVAFIVIVVVTTTTTTTATPQNILQRIANGRLVAVHGGAIDASIANVQQGLSNHAGCVLGGQIHGAQANGEWRWK
mmetsp:Transcript_19550/g.53823  ORF Transcript_19550/g.53823 Transcript_19550/m.53823 type:complete len:214 (-) Transcript_19550:336-977(-)